MNFKILTLLLGLTVISCQQTTHNEREISDLKNQADSIATVSQMVLLQKVATAIQKGGTEYAVDFCHVKAIPVNRQQKVDTRS